MGVGGGGGNLHDWRIIVENWIPIQWNPDFTIVDLTIFAINDQHSVSRQKLFRNREFVYNDIPI